MEIQYLSNQEIRNKGLYDEDLSVLFCLILKLTSDRPWKTNLILWFYIDTGAFSFLISLGRSTKVLSPLAPPIEKSKHLLFLMKISLRAHAEFLMTDTSNFLSSFCTRPLSNHSSECPLVYRGCFLYWDISISKDLDFLYP